MTEEYKGYEIVIDKENTYLICKQVDGRRLTLYGVPGSNTGKRDRYGNRLYKPFPNPFVAIEKAKEYIDLYTERLEQYVQNKLKKFADNKARKEAQKLSKS